MKSLFAFLLLCASTLAHSGSVEDAVYFAAQYKQTGYTEVFGKPVKAVYLGSDGACDKVSIVHKGNRAENFSVCDGQIIRSTDLAPKWPDTPSGRRLLQMAIQQALIGGAGIANDNGYIIRAQATNYFGRCADISIDITYDGSLSESAVQRVCR